jgi:hypothetical protein
MNDMAAIRMDRQHVSRETANPPGTLGNPAVVHRARRSWRQIPRPEKAPHASTLMSTAEPPTAPWIRLAQPTSPPALNSRIPPRACQRPDGRHPCVPTFGCRPATPAMDRRPIAYADRQHPPATAFHVKPSQRERSARGADAREETRTPMNVDASSYLLPHNLTYRKAATDRRCLRRSRADPSGYPSRRCLRNPQAATPTSHLLTGAESPAITRLGFAAHRIPYCPPRFRRHRKCAARRPVDPIRPPPTTISANRSHDERPPVTSPRIRGRGKQSHCPAVGTGIQG